MAEEKSYCLFCQKLLKGRSDKLYCNDDCRNAYFNEQKKMEHKEIRAIDLALKKNRRILKEFLGTKKTISISENRLLQKGFDLKYHTHFFRTASGDQYCFCYDYGYLAKAATMYMIVKETAQKKNDEG